MEVPTHCMMSLRTPVDIHVEQAMEVVNTLHYVAKNTGRYSRRSGDGSSNTLHYVAKNIGRLFDWVAFVAPNIHDCRLTLVGCA